MSQLLPPDMQEEFEAIIAQYMPCKKTGEIDKKWSMVRKSVRLLTSILKDFSQTIKHQSWNKVRKSVRLQTHMRSRCVSDNS